MNPAYVFPGQASQFVGMGRDLINKDSASQQIMEQADSILQLSLSNVMLEGPDEVLKETRYTQPAVFVHSHMVFQYRQRTSGMSPAAVAGHSLGEITALVAAGCITFEDGLRLVKTRAGAMQHACDAQPGTMAAILGMEDRDVEDICRSIDEIVVPANYNCPGQLVISGSNAGVAEAVERCKAAGARRAMEISVGGAFHSPLMETALTAFQESIDQINFQDASIPVYQNVNAEAVQDAKMIKANLVKQIISPVRWTQTIQNMCKDGIVEFVEVGGKGKILAGMIKKINRESVIQIWNEND